MNATPFFKKPFFTLALAALLPLLAAGCSTSAHRLEDTATASINPKQRAQLSDLALSIERAIETIPESRRPVVRMYLAGYGSAEIGELMGWTEAKARNLLYRGLADLRQRLEDAGVTPEAHD